MCSFPVIIIVRVGFLAFYPEFVFKFAHITALKMRRSDFVRFPISLPLPKAHFPSVIPLHNVLSLRPERPHLHHFATKWNKFSFDKPAGPSLAVELQPIKWDVWGGSVKPASLSFTHLCSGVLPDIHFISHCSLIHFLQKMNSSPLTVNTGITENYKRWNQLLSKTV